MLRSLSIAMVLLMVTTGGAADPKPDAKRGTFVTREFKNADGSVSPYVLFVPYGHEQVKNDAAKPTPIILFLHGAGETKGGSMQPVEQGIGPHIQRLEAKGRPFPFLVGIPQAEVIKTQVPGRWHPDNPDGQRALAILKEVTRDYNADPKRTYLTGLSMGGFGTWAIAAAHPELFAAIAPICGGGDAKWGDKLKDVPCWCFHGEQDKVVPAKLSRDMIAAIKAAGGNPRYSEFPYVGHNSWDAAYAHDELYTWFLSHTK